MARLTWTQVAAPEMGNSIMAIGRAGDTFNRGLQGISAQLGTAKADADAKRKAEVTNRALIETMNAYREDQIPEIQQYLLNNGINLGDLSDKAVERFTGLHGTMINNEQGRANIASTKNRTEADYKDEEYKHLQREQNQVYNQAAQGLQAALAKGDTDAEKYYRRQMENARTNTMGMDNANGTGGANPVGSGNRGVTGNSAVINIGGTNIPVEGYRDSDSEELNKIQQDTELLADLDKASYEPDPANRAALVDRALKARNYNNRTTFNAVMSYANAKAAHTEATGGNSATLLNKDVLPNPVPNVQDAPSQSYNIMGNPAEQQAINPNDMADLPAQFAAVASQQAAPQANVPNVAIPSQQANAPVDIANNVLGNAGQNIVSPEQMANPEQLQANASATPAQRVADILSGNQQASVQPSVQATPEVAEAPKAMAVEGQIDPNFAAKNIASNPGNASTIIKQSNDAVEAYKTTVGDSVMHSAIKHAGNSEYANATYADIAAGLMNKEGYEGDSKKAEAEARSRGKALVNKVYDQIKDMKDVNGNTIGTQINKSVIEAALLNNAESVNWLYGHGWSNFSQQPVGFNTSKVLSEIKDFVSSGQMANYNKLRDAETTRNAVLSDNQETLDAATKQYKELQKTPINWNNPAATQIRQNQNEYLQGIIQTSSNNIIKANNDYLDVQNSVTNTSLKAQSNNTNASKLAGQTVPTTAEASKKEANDMFEQTLKDKGLSSDGSPKYREAREEARKANTAVDRILKSVDRYNTDQRKSFENYADMEAINKMAPEEKEAYINEKMRTEKFGNSFLDFIGMPQNEAAASQFQKEISRHVNSTFKNNPKAKALYDKIQGMSPSEINRNMPALQEELKALKASNVTHIIESRLKGKD